MDVFYDDNGTYDDLGDYCKGSFLYDGEIYMRLNATNEEIHKGLITLYEEHPDEYVKLRALYSLLIFITNKISDKHCK